MFELQAKKKKKARVFKEKKKKRPKASEQNPHSNLWTDETRSQFWNISAFQRLGAESHNFSQTVRAVVLCWPAVGARLRASTL